MSQFHVLFPISIHTTAFIKKQLAQFKKITNKVKYLNFQIVLNINIIDF